jgi:hypothetical protein
VKLRQHVVIFPFDFYSYFFQLNQYLIKFTEKKEKGKSGEKEKDPDRFPLI